MKDVYNDEEIMLALAMKYDNDMNKVADAIRNQKLLDPNELADCIDKVEEKYVTSASNDYPNVFKTIKNPPVAVFYDGNINICNDADLYMFDNIFDSKKRGFLFTVENEDHEVEWMAACEDQSHLNEMIEKIQQVLTIFDFKDYSKDNGKVIS